MRHSTGSLQPNAVSSAAPALSTPGPGTTLNTPGRPLDARIAERHVAAGLLVPRADHFELRLMKAVEQAVDLRAGQAEHGIDAMRDQAIDDGFAAGSHVMVLSNRSQRFIRASSTTPLRKMPTPSASTSTTSPGLR